MWFNTPTGLSLIPLGETRGSVCSLHTGSRIRAEKGKKRKNEKTATGNQEDS